MTPGGVSQLVAKPSCIANYRSQASSPHQLTPHGPQPQTVDLNKCGCLLLKSLAALSFHFLRCHGGWSASAWSLVHLGKPEKEIQGWGIWWAAPPWVPVGQAQNPAPVPRLEDRDPNPAHLVALLWWQVMVLTAGKGT